MNNRYKLKITGKDPKRFITNLIKEKIYIYGMENHNKYTYIIVDDIGYKLIKEKKTSYKISIVKEYGIIKYKHLFKKYYIFILFIFIGIILLKILSNMIFDIKVEHSKSEIREMIINDLEELGIEKYKFKVSYDKKEEIKRKILKKEIDRIEWLEIESIGTKYVVKVEERIKNDVKKDTTPQNIIAKKNAMILNINATHGEVKVKKYDYVKKGDVLISGIITRDEKPMTKIKAEGEVYGEVWYKVNIDLPKQYEKITPTGNSKKRLEIKAFNKSLFLFPPKYKNYKVDRKQIITDNIIPLSINYSTLKETIVDRKKYNNNNIESDAIKIGKDKLKQKLGKKDTIIYKKVLKKTEKKSRIEVEVFFKVKEEITEKESIENINLEELKEGVNDGAND